MHLVHQVCKWYLTLEMTGPPIGLGKLIVRLRVCYMTMVAALCSMNLLLHMNSVKIHCLKS